ncbi:MAG: Fic family protein [Saprospiraceae bacterium]
MQTLPLKNEHALETTSVLKNVARAHRYLAELKGVAKSIPNESILISSLTMQEAKDSSAIENIITTHDELFQAAVGGSKKISQAAKEVENYRQALARSYKTVKDTDLIRRKDILEVQAIIEPNKPGLRKIPGTILGNADTGDVVYTPPQHPDEIVLLLDNLITYVNDEQQSDLDPLVKMALVHHQFESIHPFYDGNGRTGRILNILYLVMNQLLDLPILYLSRYIVRTKQQYYTLLQSTRETEDWEAWINYILRGIELTAKETIEMIHQMRALILDVKNRMRSTLPKIYSQELLNNLFFHPYTKVQFVIEQVGVSRVTATKYLDLLAEHNFVEKRKMGRDNYYINQPLVALILKQEHN